MADANVARVMPEDPEMGEKPTVIDGMELEAAEEPEEETSFISEMKEVRQRGRGCSVMWCSHRSFCCVTKIVPFSLHLS